MRLKPIASQVVVLMGASSGIGREAALRFALRGARLVVAARGREGLASLVAEIRRAGGEATAVVAEVTDFAQVARVAETAVTTYGGLDTWVHLAGVGLWAPFSETTPEEWRRVLDVDLNGQAYGAMAALPHLRREGRGALIHVSSVEAYHAVPYQTAYAAAKHGLHGMVKALRLELAHERLSIAVTEILPYATNTPIFDQGRSKLGVKPRPLPPIYTPAVTVEAILHAAEHPVREIVPSGIGRLGLLLQSVAPRWVDALLLRVGFRGQRTKDIKPPDAADNLYHPLRTFDRVEGSFGGEARSVSLYAWALRRPPVERAAALLVLGSLAWLWRRHGESATRAE